MKTVTLRLDDQTYRLFRDFAKYDNRTISNMIETVAKKHIRECAFVSDAEMKEILNDESLLKKLKQSSLDAKRMRGRFVD